MKVNLRYSLLETQLSPVPDDRESHSTSSGDTNISFQSTDDHLFASEELWRGRSGSTASLATPVIFQSAEERRRSFAAKSYSFGDLGPTVSADSDEAVNLRWAGRLWEFNPSNQVPSPQWMLLVIDLQHFCLWLSWYIQVDCCLSISCCYLPTCVSVYLLL